MKKIECQNCKKDFIIEPNDFGFYEKIGVLPPKICPDCRAQFRLCFRNERCFYKHSCDNCKKDIISTFSQNKIYPSWCFDCWWSDALDSKKYGMDYNSSKSFFEQFNKLWNKVPKPARISSNEINSPYTNYVADSKNCYMIIESSNNEDCINCYWIQLSKNLVDCSFTNKVEFSYEVDDCYDCHNLRFSKGCHSCLDSSFLLDCRGCMNCLGCINLRQQKYHIFNQPYTKKEYEEKIKSFKLDTHSGLESLKKEFQSFIKNKPRKFAEIFNAINSTGNYMTNVKNNRHCFHSYEAEDNTYCVHAWRGAKDCMDCNTSGREAELIYNSLNIGLQTSNVICSSFCWRSQFMEYCVNCPSSNNCFGCVGLIKGSYCIFNKQYNKEEYKKLRLEIIAKMKKGVSVVIPSFSNQKKLFRLLNSVKETKYSKIEVIVVDNSPVDEIIKKGRKKYKWVKWVDAGRNNIGQTGSYNLGFAHANQKNHILYCDEDVVVEPGMIDALVKRMETGKRIGMVTPMILYLEDKNWVNQAGAEVNLVTGIVKIGWGR